MLKHFKGALDAGATVKELSYILALVMCEAAGADDCWTHDVIGDWQAAMSKTCRVMAAMTRHVTQSVRGHFPFFISYAPVAIRIWMTGEVADAKTPMTASQKAGYISRRSARVYRPAATSHRISSPGTIQYATSRVFPGAIRDSDRICLETCSFRIDAS